MASRTALLVFGYHSELGIDVYLADVVLPESISFKKCKAHLAVLGEVLSELDIEVIVLPISEQKSYRVLCFYGPEIVHAALVGVISRNFSLQMNPYDPAQTRSLLLDMVDQALAMPSLVQDSQAHQELLLFRNLMQDTGTTGNRRLQD